MMSRYIAMYLAIPHPPDHLETPGTKSKFNENPPPRCGLLSRFFRLCLCRHLGCVRLAFFVVVLSISWTHHRTVSPANINVVIQCFQRFGTMLMPDTSFLLNVIIIHSVLLSMIRAYRCCCCSARELWVFFLTNQCKHFVRPGTWWWYSYGLFLLDGTAPNRSIHAPKSAGNTFMHAACVFFFCPILVCFLRMNLSSSLPFVTHIRGHMARTPLPFPLARLPPSF